VHTQKNLRRAHAPEVRYLAESGPGIVVAVGRVAAAKPPALGRIRWRTIMTAVRLLKLEINRTHALIHGDAARGVNSFARVDRYGPVVHAIARIARALKKVHIPRDIRGDERLSLVSQNI